MPPNQHPTKKYVKQSKTNKETHTTAKRHSLLWGREIIRTLLQHKSSLHQTQIRLSKSLPSMSEQGHNSGLLHELCPALFAVSEKTNLSSLCQQFHSCQSL